jgi:hypothetical protein
VFACKNLENTSQYLQCFKEVWIAKISFRKFRKSHLCYRFISITTGHFKENIRTENIGEPTSKSRVLFYIRFYLSFHVRENQASLGLFICVANQGFTDRKLFSMLL